MLLTFPLTLLVYVISLAKFYNVLNCITQIIPEY